MKRLTLLTAALLISAAATRSVAQTAPPLGASESFAVLAATTVTNTGATIVTGNLGLSPGTSVTGFLPGVVKNGLTYTAAASLAGPAQVSATAAYDNLKAQTSLATVNLTGKVLGETAGAVTLKPGIYTFSSSAQLNATLTLDDGGNPNAVFIFQIGSTLTTASYSKVVMSSGGKGPNVFWQIGSSATIGTYTNFAGNIIALTSITMTTGATTTGRLFALNAAVTMDTNTAFASAQEITDKDGDGVNDASDDYPEDATMAYNNYSSIGAGATSAFEDQWPTRGDFDVNDLVITSKYNAITNAKNKVVRVTGNFVLIAGGASLNNGYGVEFSILPGQVSNLKGASLEAGQKKAVLILFKDMHAELTAWNTVPKAATAEPKKFDLSFDVTDGPELNLFNNNYNEFIFNYAGSSGREVHAVGKAPTTLADLSLFGTQDDDSNVSTQRYYVTKTGLPYHIALPNQSFQYPIENADISAAYLHFREWAESGGTLFPNWYSSLEPGYRDDALIYKP